MIMIKKSYYRQFVALLLIVFTVFSFSSCGHDDSAVNKDGITSGGKLNSQKAEKKSRSDEWGLKINGKNVSLPCSLDEFLKTGINFYNEDDKEAILNSSGETFTLVDFTFGDGHDAILLKIVTGDDVNKKEKNATVKIIMNQRMDSSLFVMKDGISLGSSLDDVIKSFGDDYEVTGALREDLHDGPVVIFYGTRANGVMFHFKDGILEHIEIVADEGD